jgi:hypothetical protein
VRPGPLVIFASPKVNPILIPRELRWPDDRGRDQPDNGAMP